MARASRRPLLPLGVRPGDARCDHHGEMISPSVSKPIACHEGQSSGEPRAQFSSDPLATRYVFPWKTLPFVVQ